MLHGIGNRSRYLWFLPDGPVFTASKYVKCVSLYEPNFLIFSRYCVVEYDALFSPETNQREKLNEKSKSNTKN